jgi:ABC-type uncharacterized transport system involved in gliding motility auxiliary subunit
LLRERLGIVFKNDTVVDTKAKAVLEKPFNQIQEKTVSPQLPAKPLPKKILDKQTPAGK